MRISGKTEKKKRLHTDLKDEIELSVSGEKSNILNFLFKWLLLERTGIGVEEGVVKILV